MWVRVFVWSRGRGEYVYYGCMSLEEAAARVWELLERFGAVHVEVVEGEG